MVLKRTDQEGSLAGHTGWQLATLDQMPTSRRPKLPCLRSYVYELKPCHPRVRRTSRMATVCAVKRHRFRDLTVLLTLGYPASVLKQNSSATWFGRTVIVGRRAGVAVGRA